MLQLSSAKGTPKMDATVSTAPVSVIDLQGSGVSWPSVAAGAVAAAALTLLLVAFGAGVGLSAVSPWSDSGVSATTFKTGTGIFQIVAAVRLRKYIAGEWLLILGGIASVLFGVLITIAPLAGALVIALWVGAYTLVFGVLLIALAFRLRSWEKAAPAGPSITVPAH